MFKQNVWGSGDKFLHLVEVCGQLHAPSVSLPLKEHPVSMGMEAGWTPESFQTRWW